MGSRSEVLVIRCVRGKVPVIVGDLVGVRVISQHSSILIIYSLK